MPAYKRALLVFLLVGLAVFGGSIYGFYEQDNEKKAESIPESKETLVSELTVYVCGAVNKPGVVRLAAESRVVDAVKLCGGPLPIADITKVNMAKPLKDGEQIIVPEKPIVRESNNSAGNDAVPLEREKQSSQSDKININTADKEELDRLPGIGPAMAAAIIEYRSTEGSFQAVEDLMKVRGIGEAKFNKLKDKAAI